VASGEGAAGGRIGIAIVGTGFGRYGLAPAFRSDPRSDLVVIVGTDLAKTRRYAVELGVRGALADWREALARPDVHAVAIACPPVHQAEIAKAALAGSKAVFAEKLLAVRMEDARELAAVAAHARVANMVDYIFPELETWRQARRRIEEGAIGRVRHFFLDWRMESDEQRRQTPGWKTDSTRGGGVLQHFASHSVHDVEWMLGPIAAVAASLERAPGIPSPGESLVAATLRLSSGAVGLLSVTNAAPGGSGHRLEVYGELGMLQLWNPSRDPVAGFELRQGGAGDPAPRVVARERPPPHAGVDSRVAAVSRLVGRFLDWMETGRATRPSFQDGLRACEVIDAIQRAAAGGGWIALPPPTR